MRVARHFEQRDAANLRELMRRMLERARGLPVEEQEEANFMLTAVSTTVAMLVHRLIDQASVNGSTPFPGGDNLAYYPRWQILRLQRKGGKITRDIASSELLVDYSKSFWDVHETLGARENPVVIEKAVMPLLHMKM